MLPNVLNEFLQKPKVIQAISFLRTHQTVVAVIFLSLSIVFTGSLVVLAQQSSSQQVLAAKNKKLTLKYPTPTKTPTSTVKPTATSTPSPTLKPINTPTPTATATSTQTQTAPSSTGSKPSGVLDLANWKLTIPSGSSESPTEILQPALSSYVHDVWFSVNGGGVRFRAPVNAVTTSGSNYPRSELREMKNGGKDRADWSSTSGTHSMTIDQAITAQPSKKPHVVAGQIHDADDDVIVIRLEGPNLYVNVDGKNEYTLDSGYSLGKRFSVKFEVSGGKTNVFYNGAQVYTLDKSYSGAYFKAGAYTQSNCSKEDICSDGNYGEVVIYSLNVSHS